MRGPHNIWRLVRTGATFERTGAMGVILDAYQAPPLLRLAARILGWPFQFLGLKGDAAMPPVPRALQALGPAYIKFGQILSTRPDVVGPELALQLRVLQDKLPPFSQQAARNAVEQELGQPLESIYTDFSAPVAAASIAQVHRARLAETGADVAVKILRPGIERAFRRDVDAFYLAASIIEGLSPSSRRLRPSEVIKHFEGVVNAELDLRLEAASASEFSANTQDDPGFRLPAINWMYSTRRVMTMDWAEGVPLGDNDALDAAGLNRAVLGERVLTLFLNHALRDGFFHGDMHQGNLKVSLDGDIIAYDFGIMGHIDEYTRRVYAEILYGFIKRDYLRVAEVHFEAGYVPHDRDVDEFARALRAVGEPIFGMDATRISMGRLLSYLFEVTERFGMETRTELILLQRTMVVVEGVSRSLNPNINIWQVAQPVVGDYIRKSIGPRALLRDLGRTAQVMARFGPRLPGLVEKALSQQMAETPPQPQRTWRTRMLWGGGGLALGLLVMLLAESF
ncbi:2-polyprenylphenol 6-hydroxylase [Pseudooceanicola sediminis]|uniref:2-polyprenylphenol 6-hydroxylase n=1 Tax=Pseudooceanicola sediminis TaxID=2211117 RepID=A0A399J489_9RHOB|nr:2-polyprenylphenol 6-hydroxylase [Pseudooceanicola sediminis]KAA2315559.1 2-polyprenylphenol 6-hydroxylase [Puniceibacterium sp. HSS470]RII40238.1 2-polyprenylphenol 6-hydroxylase [Pseudooceanicola sediminis]|tara:strand:- start:26381 stop:27910 length:1530 start_codon:yes stop_codon:yes gene_type:complete